MRKIFDLPLAEYRRSNDNQIRIEFSQKLPARSAGHDRFICIRRHRDCDKIFFASGDRSTHRDSFGANRQTKRPVLDVSVCKDGPRRFDGRSDNEFWVRRISLGPRGRPYSD